jgi:hypothetical protein
MTERTTVRLPGELLARAKRKAAAEGRTLTALIEDGLRTVLAEKEKGKKAAPRRVVLPVSSATGGLRPGIDPDKLATVVQEMEDFEYIERMKRGFK